MHVIRNRIDSLLRLETGFGLFDYSEYPPSRATAVFEDPLNWMTIQIGKMCSNLGETNEFKSIAVNLNSDPSVNAIAIPRLDGSIISLNAGTCVRLRQMFMFAACDEELFPSPKVKEAIADIDTSRFGFDPTILLEKADLSRREAPASEHDYVHLYGPMPPTRSRFALAISLTTAAIDFVSMHEFTHIIRKHCELPQHLKPTSFRETGAANRGTKGNDEVIQLCEVEADVIGAGISIHKFTAVDSLDAAWRGWASNSRGGLCTTVR